MKIKERITHYYHMTEFILAIIALVFLCLFLGAQAYRLEVLDRDINKRLWKLEEWKASLWNLYRDRRISDPPEEDETR